MPGHYIPNTRIAVDIWKEPTLGKFHFLTSFLKEQTAGLTSDWKHKIFTSVINARFLKRVLKVKQRFVKEMKLGQVYTIYSNEVDSFNVSLFPSFQSPGSVMFLFTGCFGTILYTGLFRFEQHVMDNMLLKLLAKNQKLDVMYVDTYAAPHVEIPTQVDCVKRVVNIIRNTLSPSGGDGPLFVKGSWRHVAGSMSREVVSFQGYAIRLQDSEHARGINKQKECYFLSGVVIRQLLRGKYGHILSGANPERRIILGVSEEDGPMALFSIALAFKGSVKIVVSEEKCKLAHCFLQDRDACPFTDDASSSFIHAMELPLAAEREEDTASVTILLTLEYGSDCIQFGSEGLYVVPYSTHSSRSELVSFMRHLKPRCVFPIVVGAMHKIILRQLHHLAQGAADNASLCKCPKCTVVDDARLTTEETISCKYPQCTVRKDAGHLWDPRQHRFVTEKASLCKCPRCSSLCDFSNENLSQCRVTTEKSSPCKCSHCRVVGDASQCKCPRCRATVEDTNLHKHAQLGTAAYISRNKYTQHTAAANNTSQNKYIHQRADAGNTSQNEYTQHTTAAHDTNQNKYIQHRAAADDISQSKYKHHGAAENDPRLYKCPQHGPAANDCRLYEHPQSRGAENDCRLYKRPLHIPTANYASLCKCPWHEATVNDVCSGICQRHTASARKTPSRISTAVESSCLCDQHVKGMVQNVGVVRQHNFMGKVVDLQSDGEDENEWLTCSGSFESAEGIPEAVGGAHRFTPVPSTHEAFHSASPVAITSTKLVKEGNNANLDDQSSDTLDFSDSDTFNVTVIQCSQESCKELSLENSLSVNASQTNVSEKHHSGKEIRSTQCDESPPTVYMEQEGFGRSEPIVQATSCTPNCSCGSRRAGQVVELAGKKQLGDDGQVSRPGEVPCHNWVTEYVAAESEIARFDDKTIAYMKSIAQYSCTIIVNDTQDNALVEILTPSLVGTRVLVELPLLNRSHENKYWEARLNSSPAHRKTTVEDKRCKGGNDHSRATSLLNCLWSNRTNPAVRMSPSASQLCQSTGEEMHPVVGKSASNTCLSTCEERHSDIVISDPANQSHVASFGEREPDMGSCDHANQSSGETRPSQSRNMEVGLDGYLSAQSKTTAEENTGNGRHDHSRATLLSNCSGSLVAHPAVGMSVIPSQLCQTPCEERHLDIGSHDTSRSCKSSSEERHPDTGNPDPANLSCKSPSKEREPDNDSVDHASQLSRETGALESTILDESLDCFLSAQSETTVKDNTRCNGGHDNSRATLVSNCPGSVVAHPAVGMSVMPSQLCQTPGEERHLDISSHDTSRSCKSSSEERHSETGNPDPANLVCKSPIKESEPENDSADHAIQLSRETGALESTTLDESLDCFLSAQSETTVKDNTRCNGGHDNSRATLVSNCPGSVVAHPAVGMSVMPSQLCQTHGEERHLDIGSHDTSRSFRTSSEERHPDTGNPDPANLLCKSPIKEREPENDNADYASQLSRETGALESTILDESLDCFLSAQSETTVKDNTRCNGGHDNSRATLVSNCPGSVVAHPAVGVSVMPSQLCQTHGEERHLDIGSHDTSRSCRTSSEEMHPDTGNPDPANLLCKSPIKEREPENDNADYASQLSRETGVLESTTLEVSLDCFLSAQYKTTAEDTRCNDNHDHPGETHLRNCSGSVMMYPAVETSCSTRESCQSPSKKIHHAVYNDSHRIESYSDDLCGAVATSDIVTVPFHETGCCKHAPKRKLLRKIDGQVRSKRKFIRKADGPEFCAVPNKKECGNKHAKQTGNCNLPKIDLSTSFVDEVSGELTIPDFHGVTICGTVFAVAKSPTNRVQEAGYITDSSGSPYQPAEAQKCLTDVEITTFFEEVNCHQKMQAGMIKGTKSKTQHATVPEVVCSGGRGTSKIKRKSPIQLRSRYKYVGTKGTNEIRETSSFSTLKSRLQSTRQRRVGNLCLKMGKPQVVSSGKRLRSADKLASNTPDNPGASRAHQLNINHVMSVSKFWMSSDESGSESEEPVTLSSPKPCRQANKGTMH